MKDILVIQPKREDLNHPAPYAWFVEKTGRVQHQNYWNGVPCVFLGLTDTTNPDGLMIKRKDLFQNLTVPSGLHSVFKNKGGKPYVYTGRCDIRFAQEIETK